MFLGDDFVNSENDFNVDSYLPLKSHKAVECGLATWQGREVFVKRYPSPKGIRKVKEFCHGSSALRSAKGSNILLKHGFNTPVPLKIVENYDGILPGSSVVIYESYSDCVELATLLNNCKRNADLAQFNKLLKGIAGEIANLHIQKIVHGDMTVHNNLVRQSGEQFKFIWIDNRKTYKAFFLNTKKIVRNLSQLASHSAFLSDRSKLRFLFGIQKAARIK